MELPQGNRFTYIIGNNGSGKSRALEHGAQMTSEFRPAVVISSSFTDKFTYRKDTKSTGKGSYTYLGNRTVGNATHVNTLSANVVLYFVRIKASNGATARFFDFLASIGFEKKVGVQQRKIKRLDVTESFQLSEITDAFVEEHKAILEGEHKPFEAVFYKNEQPYRFAELSSGEQSIIANAAKISSHLGPDTCFFIDEPEISLHVEWQIRWPEILSGLLQDMPNARCFIATHSPIIISSALKIHAHCYSLDQGNYIPIVEEDLNVEKLIFRDFHTFTADNRHLYSEFAQILTRTIDGLNSRRRETVAEATADVTDLKDRVARLSKVEAESSEIEKAVSDFESAIEEVLNQEGKSVAIPFAVKA